MTVDRKTDLNPNRVFLEYDFKPGLFVMSRNNTALLKRPKVKYELQYDVLMGLEETILIT